MPVIETIPERYLSGYLYLVSMDDKQFQKIIDKLSTVEIKFDPLEFAEIIVKSFDKDAQDSIRSLIIGIEELLSFSDTRKCPISKVIDDLCEIVKLKIPADADFDGKIEKIYRERLLQLFENRKIYQSAKSTSLFVSHDKLFISAKITSDIRPVFGLKANKRPEAAFVSNVLNIHFSIGEDTNHKDIFIALDNDDIKALKETLIRAEKKNKILNSIISQSGMENVD